MRRFEFSAAPVETPFRDVREAMESLELARVILILPVGLDLAKTVFQMHRADVSGRTMLRKKLRRDQLPTHH